LREAVAYAQRGLGGRASATHGWASLSRAERQVVELASQGLTNPAIARELFMSESAVSKHTAGIFDKLGLVATDDDNRRVLAVLTYLNG
ncbi:MAG TPA: helix-turn-helix transcriptional regulator, partial [Chloroflexota bacterium]